MAMPPSGRNKKDNRLVRSSSTKRKLEENSSLGFEREMQKDSDNPLEIMQEEKCRKSGSSKKYEDKENKSKKKQRVESVELAQLSHDNLGGCEPSDDDFSSIFEVTDPKNHRSTSKGRDMSSSNSRKEKLKLGADKDADVKSFDESNQSSSDARKSPQGFQGQPDEVREPSETQNMFITQRDAKHKPKGILPKFSASRKHTAEDKMQSIEQGKKQQHLTLSQVKQLYRSNISKAVMTRHRSCPIKLPSSYSSKSKNQEEHFFRKLKALKQKRKTSSSQASSGDGQLSPHGELPKLSRQTLFCGTHMFPVSCDKAEPLGTESQSLIPPMVVDVSSSEESEEDTFEERLAMKVVNKKERRRCNSSGIFETQEPGMWDVKFLADVSKSNEEVSKNKGNNIEARSQITLGKMASDLSPEPAVKDNNESVGEEDADVETSGTCKDDHSFTAPVPPDIAGKPAEGQLFSNEGVDQITDEESSKVKEAISSWDEIFVLETELEKGEPEVGVDEATVRQKHDVTVVPDSHDMSGGSLPRYHFTSDDDSNNELDDIFVSQAVSEFLDTCEDSENDRPLWEEEGGKECKGHATKEKKKQLRSDTLKGTEQVKHSGNDSFGSDKSGHGFPKKLQESVVGFSAESKKSVVEAKKMIVRADVHAVDIPTSNISSPISSGSRKKSSSGNSSKKKSQGQEEAACPMETMRNAEVAATFGASNMPADSWDGSQETCLTEVVENFRSAAQKKLCPGSGCDERELREIEILAGESSPEDAVCDVAVSLPQLSGSKVDSSGVGVSVTSSGESRKCKRVTTHTQTDITMEDFQCLDSFNICMELKRMLLEEYKSINTTSGSTSSYESSTLKRESRNHHKREGMIALLRLMDNLLTANKNCDIDMDEGVSCGKGNPASENDLKWKTQKFEKDKRLKAKKREQNDESKNIRQTIKKKKRKLAADGSSLEGDFEGNLGDRITKKKKKASNQTSPGGRRNNSKESKTKIGNNTDESDDVRQTTKKNHKSLPADGILNIPIESIPSPEEVKRQWEKKQDRRKRKQREKKNVKLVEEIKSVDKGVSSSSFDSSQEEKGSPKEKQEVKEKGKASEKTCKQDGEEDPDQGVSDKRKKKVTKHKKKKKK